MRLFRAKEVTFFTLRDKITVFLRRDEIIPFFNKPPRHYIKPKLRQLAFGAFIDVRALGAVAVFAAVLRRIGTIFGGKYLDNILDLLDTAADNVERVFSAAKIYVPRIAAALGVFAFAAWTFAYLKRLVSLLNFRFGRSGEYIIVRSGLFTLYEHTLVYYNAAAAAAIQVNSPVSLAAKHAPVYLRDVMIYPCADRSTFTRLSRIILGREKVGKAADIRPPKRAILGYCALPLFWSTFFIALLMIIYISKALRGAMLIKTALYCGLLASLYSIAVCLFYMKHSGVDFGDRSCRVSVKRSFRLYTAVLRRDTIVGEELSQNVFQSRTGLCRLKISTSERRKFDLRQLPKEKLPDAPLF